MTQEQTSQEKYCDDRIKELANLQLRQERLAPLYELESLLLVLGLGGGAGFLGRSTQMPSEAAIDIKLGICLLIVGTLLSLHRAYEFYQEWKLRKELLEPDPKSGTTPMDEDAIDSGVTKAKKNVDTVVEVELASVVVR